MKSDLRVTVLVMTYNHADYIQQALDSVLMQKVSFAYEILISEDCSTDGTREMVQHYQSLHPYRIRLLLSPHNIRNNTVVTRGIAAARGDYIALLDGDDYWTSDQKLQRQVEFLDAHPTCSLCFHNALVVDESKGQEPWQWTPTDHPTISTLEQIWMGNFIATCSTMFRRPGYKIPSWYISMFPITDWPLHLLNAEVGDIGFINEVMGVYRYHSRGFYSPLSEERKLEETRNFYQRMKVNFDHKYDKLINVALSKYFTEWAEEYNRRGEVEKARTCLMRSLQGQAINTHISAKRLLLLMLRLSMPRAAMRLATSLQKP